MQITGLRFKSGFISLYMIFLAVLFSDRTVSAKSYYVDMNASPNGDGSPQHPFRSIQKAADLLMAGDTCYIKGGIYPETVIPRYSGTFKQQTVFRPWGSTGKVVISGSDPINQADWVAHSPNIYKTSLLLKLGHENQVFRNDTMLVLARWPNVGEDLLFPTLSTMQKGTTANRIVDSLLPPYDLENAYVWVHAPEYWSNWTTDIVGFGRHHFDIVNRAPFQGAMKHNATEGAQYYLFGAFSMLDNDNEWYYDETTGTLYIYATSDSPSLGNIRVKQRKYAFDLADRRHIIIQDIEIHGASILTDERTSHVLLSGLRIYFPYHAEQANEQYGTQKEKGVVINGTNNVIQSCEIAYSSGCGVVLAGSYNHLVNSYIHDTDYIGTYASCVQLSGKRNIISHCTLTRSGRSVIDYSGMYQCIIQYNDLSYSGLLTSDLGVTYGTVIEGGNSEIRYNWFHDNKGVHRNVGLYYDHGTQNIVTHHNVVWGSDLSALMINHYAHYHLVYHNNFSAVQYGFRSRWGNKYLPSLQGSEFYNNIFSGPVDITASDYVWRHNLIGYDMLIDDKYLSAGSSAVDSGIPIEGINDKYIGSAPDIGAYESGGHLWHVGHNFDVDPIVDTAFSLPRHRNLIENAAFEHEDHLKPWSVTAGSVAVQSGYKNQTTPDTARLRMGKYSLMLKDTAQIEQQIFDLEPNSTYRFAGFFRLDPGERAVLGVRKDDGQEVLGSVIYPSNNFWVESVLEFMTDPDVDTVHVFVKRLPGNQGNVFVDDFGLILKREDDKNVEEER